MIEFALSMLLTVLAVALGAYAAAGKPRLEEIYYRKSLEIDPQNENALAKLETLRK